MGHLEVIDEAHCLELLLSGVVGRVAVHAPGGPLILPVNYAVIDHAVVFRTAPDSVFGTHAWRARITFQVDQVDHDPYAGWSVLAVGHGERVDPGPELDAIIREWDPQPWVSGTPVYVRMCWDSLTGRRACSDCSGVSRAAVLQTV